MESLICFGLFGKRNTEVTAALLLNDSSRVRE